MRLSANRQKTFLLTFVLLELTVSPAAQAAGSPQQTAEEPDAVQPQSWGLGVTFSSHCAYDPAGSCPQTSWGLMGFSKSAQQPLLFSGGASISNTKRWVDRDGKKQKRTLIDLYLNTGYRLRLWEMINGHVASSFSLDAGFGLGLRLRIKFDVTTHEVLDLSVDVPDPKGTLQPYGHLWLLAGLSHVFVMLTADIGDSTSLNVAFGLGF